MIATVTLNPSLDAWVELSALRVGALNRATGFCRSLGGKGINVSRVVQELGERPIAFGVAGGEDGLNLRQLMSRVHLRHEFVAIPGTTRSNYKVRTATHRAVTEINTSGPRVPRNALRILEHTLFDHRPTPHGMVFSGSLPPGVPVTIYQRWIRRARRASIPTILDASGQAFHEGLRARPWLIKPNRHEAEELLRCSLKSRVACVRAASELLRLGAEVVVLSLGAEGALIAGSVLDGLWFAAPPRVHVDSTVGAGDALIGGLLVGWLRHRSLLEAFRLGVACGAATAMTPGTELCHRATVRRLLPRVRLHRVA